MSVTKLNSVNFYSSIEKGTALVDFYADWCGPCRTLSFVLDRISEERRDVSVCKVNVDDEGELSAKYNVMSIPTVIVFEDGKEKSRIVGSKTKAEILASL